ncbi:MAG: MOSC domain-containing protein [Actinomycetota bacterium]|nr:MOSC domain-containing protein [Actinomycetota bacterium]
MGKVGRLVSVNVGRPRPVQMGKRTRVTGIFKEPQKGPVRVAGVTVGDDVQVDKRHHGGADKAVYAYALEDYRWWEEQLERELPPGTFGDNLTTEGLDVTGCLIGERWRIGDVVLEVTDPRIPCSTLRARMGIPGFVKTFAAARRFGAYMRIVAEGDVQPGDSIEVVERPSHGISIARMGGVYFDGDLGEAEAIYEALGHPESRRAWVEDLRRGAGAAV